MKKLALTIAIVLGMAVGAMAQQQYSGGLFDRGYVSDEVYYGSGNGSNHFTLLRDPAPIDINLPYHGETTDEDAPLGGGVVLLLGMGGAYLVAKRRKE